MKSKSTIEVNGNHYDAVTGAVLGQATAPTVRHSGRNIDGFFRPRSLAVPTKPEPVSGSIATLNTVVPSAPELHPGRTRAKRAVNHTKAHTPQPARNRAISIDHQADETHTVAVSRRQPNHVHHHTAQHSRTLRRDSVPAPQLSTHALLKPKSTIAHQTPGAIAFKKSADTIDPSRLVRAQGTAKSPQVSRYAAPATSLLPTFSPVAVQPLPTSEPPQSSAPPGMTPQSPKDIFEKALANATNFVDIQQHKTVYRKKARTHVASMAAGSLALIIIATFVAYQNSPAFQFKVASVRAGISTNMPNFAAAGFRYNGARSGDGKLTVGFTNSAGTYQLTQAATNFSDTDMIQAIGATDASGTPTYSVVQANGVDIYRFSNTSATWVSGGKWYTVNGTGALTNDQVKSLAQHV